MTKSAYNHSSILSTSDMPCEKAFNAISEMDARKILDIAGVIILALDNKGKIALLNAKGCEILGCKANEVIGKDWCKTFLPRRIRAKMKSSYDRMVFGDLKPVEHIEKPVLTFSGEERIIAWHISLLKDKNGKVLITICSGTDVTEYKQATETLRESEAFNSLLLDQAPNPILVTDELGSIKYVNPSLENLSGYFSNELLETKPPYPWWPLEMRQQYLKQGVHNEEKPVSIIERYQRSKSGGIFWIAGNIKAIKSKGKVKYNIVNWVDITRLKELEYNIRQQNARLISILESSKSAIYMIDRNLRFVAFNGVYRRFMKSVGGVDVEVGKSLRDYKIPCTLSKIITGNLNKAFQGMGYSIERWVGSGHVPKRFVELTYKPIRDEEDVIIGVVVFINDITDSKRIENALRESNAFNTSLLENIPNPIILLNFDFSVRYVNPAFETMTGFSGHEIIGKKSPYSWWPEDKIQEYSKANRILVNRRFNAIERCYRKKNGELFWVGLTVKYMKNGDNNAYYLGNWVDITRQKLYEEELRHSREQIRRFASHLQERIEAERKQLSTEIHDELGQMLTALKIDLSWLLKRLPDESELLTRKAKSIMELVDDTDKVVKRMSISLRPTILDDLGLPAALRWLVEQFQLRTDIASKLEVADDLSLDHKTAINVFRIVQEALTNVARHARASQVQIRLNVRYDNLNLVIKDNGIGIDQGKISNGYSFGLMGMVERTHEMGGRVEFRGIANKGTVIRLNIPLKGN